MWENEYAFRDEPEPYYCPFGEYGVCDHWRNGEPDCETCEAAKEYDEYLRREEGRT